MLNEPHITERIVREATIVDTYDRAHTALVMARADAHNLVTALRSQAHLLRAEADKIDAFLEKATREADSWYANIAAERDLAHDILKD